MVVALVAVVAFVFFGLGVAAFVGFNVAVVLNVSVVFPSAFVVVAVAVARFFGVFVRETIGCCDCRVFPWLL